jgi:hypothetical protein
MKYLAPILVVAALLMSYTKASPHDHSRPELDQWFKELRAKGGAPCCDGSDAHSVEDPNWEMKDGHYRVRLNGEWVDVPDEAVVAVPNKFGPALVWPYEGDKAHQGVRCFMPGMLA